MVPPGLTEHSDLRFPALPWGDGDALNVAGATMIMMRIPLKPAPSCGDDDARS
jgi:hypothetical protein